MYDYFYQNIFHYFDMVEINMVYDIFHNDYQYNLLNNYIYIYHYHIDIVHYLNKD